MMLMCSSVSIWSSKLETSTALPIQLIHRNFTIRSRNSMTTAWGIRRLEGNGYSQSRLFHPQAETRERRTAKPERRSEMSEFQSLFRRTKTDQLRVTSRLVNATATFPIPNFLPNSFMRNLLTAICPTVAMLLGSTGMSWDADFEKGLTA